MNFETSLRERFYKQTLENTVRNFDFIWNSAVISNETLSDNNFKIISSAYSVYLDKKMSDISEEELFRLCDEFDDAISPDALMELKKHVELSKQEKSYIMYRTIYRERSICFF